MNSQCEKNSHGIDVYYTAIIIEPRIHSNLIKVINKFYTYLIDWKIIFYCGKKLKIFWKDKLPDI
jgi:hypothetical protein